MNSYNSSYTMRAGLVKEMSYMQEKLKAIHPKKMPCRNQFASSARGSIISHPKNNQKLTFIKRENRAVRSKMILYYDLEIKQTSSQSIC